ncbi:MAG: cysteine hydrolase [Acidobacteriota bacterium]
MDPRTTALILVGYQHDEFVPAGILRSAHNRANSVGTAMANAVELIRAMAPIGVSILATTVRLTPDFRTPAPQAGIPDTVTSSGASTTGDAGPETISQWRAFGACITRVAGDAGLDGFSTNTLDAVLKQHGIRDVLVAGTANSLCIDSTCRAASDRGYRVTVVSDCTAGRTPAEHDFYCQHIFPLFGGVMDSRKAIEQLSSVTA